MCGGSGPTSTTSTNLPSWVSDAGKDIYGKAKDFYSQPYNVPAQGVADFAGDQQQGFQALRDYTGSGGTQPSTSAGLDLINQGASAPRQQVQDPGRVIDQGGRLGAISDYMNPYTQGVLDPTLRQMGRARDTAIQGNEAGAIAHGAFGDARHGIVDQGVNRDYMTGVGDATNRAYSDAYNSGMAARTGDLNRMVSTDQTNAGLGEAAAGRNIQGGGSLISGAGAGQQNLLSGLSALFTSGNLQQQHAQSQMDSQYQLAAKQYQDQYDKIAQMVSVMGATPYNRTQTTTQTPGNAGLLGGLGSLLGAGASAFMHF